MSVLAIVLLAALAVVAGLHAYWGFGGRWPGHNEASLAERVIGRTPGGRMPSPLACFAVALALAAGMAFTWAVGFVDLPSVPASGLVRIAAGVFAVVFLLRGAAGYAPGLWRDSVGTPFATLNTRCYSPLCLTLGVGLVILLIGRAPPP